MEWMIRGEAARMPELETGGLHEGQGVPEVDSSTVHEEEEGRRGVI
jgi:hypothetical protein